MGLQFKQRLIGAILLIALGVIVIPIFLDGAPTVEEQQRADIPPAPTLPEISHLEPPVEAMEIYQASPDVLAALPEDNDLEVIFAEPLEEEPAPEKALEEVAVEEAAPLNLNNPDEGWIVQIGTFSNEDNALSLKSNLKSEGYLAQTQSIPREDASALIKIYIGPVADRTEAESLLIGIAADFGLEGLIVSYPGNTG